MSTWLPVTVTAGTPARGTGTQTAASFQAQAMTATFSWGSQPGSATLVYVPPNIQAGGSGVAAGLATGAFVELEIGSHFFAGICKTDVETVGSHEGILRTLQFSDLREYLTWDYSFCCFNKVDVRLVNGVRTKRYKHVYPADYPTLTWTFTSQALTAAQIIGAIFSYRNSNLSGGVPGGTIGCPWEFDLTGGGQFPQGLMNFPIYDLDCLQGKRLDSVLSEIAERSGCTFTLFSTA